MRIPYVIPILALAAAGVHSAMAGISLTPSGKRAYIQMQTGDSTADLSPFVAKLLELRLASVREVRVARSGEKPPCEVGPAAEAARTDAIGKSGYLAEKYYVVAGAVTGEPGAYTFSYLLNEIAGCQATSKLKGSKSFDNDAALGTINDIADDIADKIAEAASDKIPVELSISDEELRSYMEIAFRDSDQFRLTSERSSAQYTVTATPVKGSQQIHFTIAEHGAQEIVTSKGAKTVTAFDSPKPAKGRKTSYALLDASRYALSRLGDMDSLRAAGISEDPATLNLGDAVERARTFSCADQTCNAKPAVVIALLRNQEDQFHEADKLVNNNRAINREEYQLLSEAEEMLGDAWRQTDSPHQAALAYDKALTPQVSAAIRRELLAKAGGAYLDSDDASTAVARWRQLEDLEKTSGSPRFETEIHLARALSSADRDQEAWKILLDLAGRSGDETGVAPDGDKIIGTMDAAQLPSACQEADSRSAHLLAGSCQVVLGRRKYQQADKAGAQDAFRKAIGLFRKTIPLPEDRLADALSDLAESVDWEKPAERSQALAASKEALDIRQRLHGSGDDKTGDSEFQMGLILDWDGGFGEARKHLEKALTAGDRASTQSEKHAMTERILAVVEAAAGDFTDVEKHYRAALAVFERTQNKAAAAVTHDDLGSALVNMGRYTQAEAEFRKALEIENVLSPDSDSVAGMQAELARALSEEGRFQEAKELALRSLAIRQKADTADSAALSTSYGDLGLVLLYSGENNDSLANLTQALEIRTRLENNPESNKLSADENNLGLILLALARYDESAAHLAKAARMDSEIYGADSYYTAYEEIRVAEPLIAAGHLAEAGAILTKDLPNVAGGFAHDRLQYTRSMYIHAEFLLASGKPEAALPEAEEALALRENAKDTGAWRQSIYLLQVGRIQEALRHPAEAAANYKKVADLWQGLGLPDHPDAAIAKAGLERIAAAQGVNR